MKKLLIALPLLLFAAPAFAGFCGPDALYFKVADNDPPCQAEMELYQDVTIDVWLEVYDRPGPLRSVSFRVDNWIEVGDPPGGVYIVMWSAPQVEGDGSGSGVILTWPDGLAPVDDGLRQTYLLGSFYLRPMTEDWIPQDHVASIYDLEYVDMGGSVFAAGNWASMFTFNPGPFSDGYCLGDIFEPDGNDWCDWRFVLPPDGSIVVGDFSFQGEAQHWTCLEQEAGAVSVALTLDGAPIGEYAGVGELQVNHLVDVSGVEPGAEFTVGVHFAGEGCEAADYTYTYTLDPTTATEPTSFSAVKSRY